MEALLQTIGTLGLCSCCRKWVPLQLGRSRLEGLPEHNNATGKRKCRGSGYSPWEYKYVVRNDEEALALATFITEDNEICLDARTCSPHSHTINCGDGRRCAETRQKLAKALAEYCLQKKIFSSSEEEAA